MQRVGKPARSATLDAALIAGTNHPQLLIALATGTACAVPFRLVYFAVQTLCNVWRVLCIVTQLYSPHALQISTLTVNHLVHHPMHTPPASLSFQRFSTNR
jgi:hypothetical protein